MSFFTSQWLEMAEGAYDLYNFDDDDYVESQTLSLSDSFMEMFQEDSSEDDISGFTSEEAFVYRNRLMNEFHTATDPAVQEAVKESVSPATKLGKSYAPTCVGSPLNLFFSVSELFSLRKVRWQLFQYYSS